MLPRFLAIFVVLFWMVSTGWLVRSIWFEEEYQFEPVAAEEALGAFFQWNDSSTLTVLHEGQPIGQMIMNASEGQDPRTGEFLRGFSTKGTLDEGRGSLSGAGLENLAGATWRVATRFDEQTELEAFELVIWVPRQALDLRVELAGDPPQLAARATMAETVLLEVGQLSADVDSSPGRGKDGASKPTGASVLPPAAAAGWLPGGAMLADESAWRPRIEASRGVMKVAGSDQPVYLVKVSFGQDEQATPLRLYFSEAGEPWRIDTGWGFEAIADVLIPVEDQLP